MGKGVNKEQRQWGLAGRKEVKRRQETEAGERRLQRARERDTVDWPLQEFQRAVKPYRPPV